MAGERYPHIQLNENFRTPLAYTRRPPNIQTPPQERSVEHGQQIRRKFDEAWTNAGNQTALGQATRDGVALVENLPQWMVLANSLVEIYLRAEQAALSYMGSHQNSHYARKLGVSKF